MDQDYTVREDRLRKRDFLNTYKLTPDEAADAWSQRNQAEQLTRARVLKEAAWERAEQARKAEEQAERALRSQHVPNDPGGSPRPGIHPLRY